MRSTFFGKRLFGAAFLAAVLACWTLLAMATSQEPGGKNAADAKAATKSKEKKAPDGNELLNPFEVCSVGGKCEVVLEAVVRTHAFPAAGNYFLSSPVYVLKEANGKKYEKKDGDNCLVGPTIRVKPGDLLKIRINNKLDRKYPGIVDVPDNYPHGFNITNLHTHGLHVSPSGNADNVYATILPGGHRQYEYRIPPDHPPGTFWYHPHRHGSVALQITGGMAGALIVDGDHDALAKGAEKPCDRIFVLQQIHGTQNDPNSNVLMASLADIYDKIASATAASSGATVSLKSLRRVRGENLQRAAKEKKPAPKVLNKDCSDDNPIDPKDTKEWLLVNGQNPQCRTIPIQRGEMQRWRFVHAGIDEIINLVVWHTDAKQNKRKVAFTEIAVDGIPRGRGVKAFQKYLYPAYRVDVLFKVPNEFKQGDKLELWNETAPANVTLSGNPTQAQRIATIDVKGKKPMEMAWPNDDALASCVPLAFRSGISSPEVGNRRWSLRFNFPDNPPSRFPINGHEYGMDLIDRHVRLDTAEEWLLASGAGTNNNAGHPFHIHVNPFYHLAFEGVLSLKQTNGAAVTPQTLIAPLFDKNDKAKSVTFTVKFPSGETFTSETAVTATTTAADLARDLDKAMKAKVDDGYKVEIKSDVIFLRTFRYGVDDLVINQVSDSAILKFAPDRQLVDFIWRDTLLAPSSGPAEIVRMRFRDYTGDTVLHCHIVDHEDQGMMKNIRILPALDPEPNPIPIGEPKQALKKASAPAPALRLPDTDKKLCDLTDFRGRNVVLVFIQGVQCIHCVQDLRELVREARGAIDSNTEIVAVSSRKIDDPVQALKVLGVVPADRFRLLVDDEHKAFRAFACYDDGPMHGLFLIDRDGVLRAKYTGEAPFDDAREVVRQARTVAAGLKRGE